MLMPDANGTPAGDPIARGARAMQAYARARGMQDRFLAHVYGPDGDSTTPDTAPVAVVPPTKEQVRARAQSLMGKMRDGFFRHASGEPSNAPTHADVPAAPRGPAHRRPRAKTPHTPRAPHASRVPHAPHAPRAPRIPHAPHTRPMVAFRAANVTGEDPASGSGSAWVWIGVAAAGAYFLTKRGR